jgi:CCR4-NOT transcription complex subunit 9
LGVEGDWGIAVVTLVVLARSMAGLVSPKPISYLQQTNSHYNNYARSHQGFSETPPLSTLPHAIPQSQFTPGPTPTSSVQEDGKIYGLVIDLLEPNTRESALLELSKKREQYDDLALVLWHSFGALSYLSSLTIR